MSEDINDYNNDKNLGIYLLNQAYNDLIFDGSTLNMEMVSAIRDARSFFDDQSGAWAESRKIWCEIAEIEESILLGTVEKVRDIAVRQDEKIAAFLQKKEDRRCAKKVGSIALKKRPPRTKRLERIRESNIRRLHFYQEYKNGKSIKFLSSENCLSYNTTYNLVRAGEQLEKSGWNQK